MRGIELRYYLVAAHYRSHVEFSFEALDEAAAGFQRIENFLDRAGRSEPGEIPEAFAAAMDDDLGTPAAVAVLYDAVREGNRQLAAGEDAGATAGQVRAMLDVLGLDPEDPAWPSSGGGDAKLTSAVDVLVAGLLEQARRGPRRPRTSPPPTRSATRSRPPASRSRTPPTDRRSERLS